MPKFTWCLPTVCPLCFRTVQHIRFEAEAGMCTLWCGCRVSVEDWGDSYRPEIRNVTDVDRGRKCPQCHGWHADNGGCAA